MQGGSDISRTRKHNQSSLQIAANSIIEGNNPNRPSLIGNSGQGLPPRGGANDIMQKKTFDNSQNINSMGGGNGQQYNYTEGDNISQSIEDSGQINSEIVLERNTDEYISDLKKGNANILVGVRCRPLSKKEKEKQSLKSVKILDEKIIILQDVSAAKPEEAFRLARPKEKTYAFDYAFDETCDQKYIFDRCTKFLIEGIMQGYNASVFAYGATGAGKTYTMLGTEENPGIMLLSIDELFISIEKYSFERDYKLKISYVEVYNECIKDLLTDRSENLDLREDNIKGVCVAGVTEIMTTNVDEIMRYIRQGNRMRTKERTDANEASSRSHAVLQITVEHKDKAHGINAEINIAKLSLIDLAGSERASNTNNRGIRLVEGANINKSLLALGNCINALCDQAKMGPNAAKNQHIPYRDSKLTRLLKDSLGGNCRTVMITNISPAFTAYEDTLNTLKYADRAKQIKTIVKRNVLNVEFHISNYTKIINQLREEIVSLRSQLLGSGNLNTPQPKSILNSNQNSGQKGSVQSNQVSQKDQMAQNKLKTMKIEMNLQFEKEVTIKKEIYELDMKNEDLAFKLFSKQMILTKNKGKNQASTQQIELDVNALKVEIEQNYRQKATLANRLSELENSREKQLEDYQQQTLQFEIEAIDVLYNQHLLNLKQIDIKRKENRADFHIKQRDNYIQHLKEQLSLRDRIIKDKLGLSITNFMPGGNINTSDNSFDILTMQDIDKMSKELILPSLNMTKSSSFIPHTFSTPLDNSAQKKLDISDSPYSQGISTILNQSPNQRSIVNSISVQNKNKPSIIPRSYQNKSEDSSLSSGYTNQIKTNSSINNPSNAYYSSDIPKYQGKPQGQSMIKPPSSIPSVSAQLDKKIGMKNQASDLYQNDSDPSNINHSFSSHRNNSNSRIGMGINNAYSQQNNLIGLQSQQQTLQPPGTSGGNSDQQPSGKSFASEMSKNKQKFMMMQKQQIQNPNDVFAVRQGRAIPKNPLSINKKLTLLKKNQNINQGHLSGDEAQTAPLAYQSSRNQSQNPVGNRVNGSSIMQNNGNQIAGPSFGIRKISESPNPIYNYSNNNQVGNSVNNSVINIADN